MSSPERRTNVLLVASSLWIGGAETVIRNLALTIDRAQFNVAVCYLKQPGQIGRELSEAGVDIVGITEDPNPKVDYLTFRKLLRVIRAKQAHVVHTHTTHGLVDACLCRLLVPRLRVVHTFHFGNYPHTKPRIVWMERVFSRFADRLFAVGDVQRQQVLETLHLSQDRLGTIWNGVPLPTTQGDGAFRRGVGGEGKVLVGTIATLIKQKGLEDLLKVAQAVTAVRRDVRFVIVGEGHLRARLEAMRRELGLDDVVTLTGWVTSASEVALPDFDIFFQPSLWEAMSVVILEAMAAAKPIVATRVGENQHVIEDGLDGVLVAPGDTGSMTANLIRLIDDPDLRLRLGGAARRKVERRLTVNHMTRAYERVYLEVGR